MRADLSTVANQTSSLCCTRLTVLFTCSAISKTMTGWCPPFLPFTRISYEILEDLQSLLLEMSSP